MTFVKGEKMNRKRTIHKLLAIFDLLNIPPGKLPGKSSLRIMYEYNVDKNGGEFTVLSKDVPREDAQDIIAWLKENVSAEDMIYGEDPTDLDFGMLNGRKKAA